MDGTNNYTLSQNFTLPAVPSTKSLFLEFYLMINATNALSDIVYSDTLLVFIYFLLCFAFLFFLSSIYFLFLNCFVFNENKR